MERKIKLDEVTDQGSSFILKPAPRRQRSYHKRTDRNIGWITHDEQAILRNTTVGIAGCGGMGGLLSATLLRAGIGRLKIADPEKFDESNLNRQFAAKKGTLGLSKAVETARMLREIADDTCIAVFPEGISAKTVKEFSDGCDVICDEIEFWAVGARLLLHQHMPFTTTILNSNSIGMGTRLFRFRKSDTCTMANLLRLELSEASGIEKRIRSKTASKEDVLRIQNAVLTGLVPELPEYMTEADTFSNRKEVRRRLFAEGKAPILATNPPMATGFLANHVILEILRQKSGMRRAVVYPPDMPGYLYFDAALMRTASVTGAWW